MDPSRKSGLLSYFSDFINTLVGNDVPRPPRHSAARSDLTDNRQAAPASTSTLLGPPPRRILKARASTSAAAIIPHYGGSCTTPRRQPHAYCELCAQRHARPCDYDSSSSSVVSFIDVTSKDSEIEIDVLRRNPKKKESGRKSKPSVSSQSDCTEKDDCHRSSRPRARRHSKLPVRSSSENESPDSPSSLRRTEPAKDSRGDHSRRTPVRSLKQTHHRPAEYGERTEGEDEEISRKQGKTSITSSIENDRDSESSTSSGKYEDDVMEEYMEKSNFMSIGTQVSSVFIQERSDVSPNIEWKGAYPKSPSRRSMGGQGEGRRPTSRDEGPQEEKRSKQNAEKLPVVHIEGDEILRLPAQFDEPLYLKTEEQIMARLLHRATGQIKLSLDGTPKKEESSQPPSRKNSDVRKQESSTESGEPSLPERKASSNQEPPEEKLTIIRVYPRDDQVLRFHSDFTPADMPIPIKASPFRSLRQSCTSEDENEGTPAGTSIGSVYSTTSAQVFSKLRKAVQSKRSEGFTRTLEAPTHRQEVPRPEVSRQEVPQYPSWRPITKPRTVVYASTSRDQPLAFPGCSKDPFPRMPFFPFPNRRASAEVPPLFPIRTPEPEPSSSTSQEFYEIPTTSRTVLCPPFAPCNPKTTPRAQIKLPTPKPVSEETTPTQSTTLCSETELTYSTDSEMNYDSRQESRTSVTMSDKSARGHLRLKRTDTFVSLDMSEVSTLTTIDEEKISIYSTMTNSKANLSPYEATMARYDELDSAAALAKAMRKQQLKNNQFPLDDVERKLLARLAENEETEEEDSKVTETETFNENSEITTDEELELEIEEVSSSDSRRHEDY